MFSVHSLLSTSIVAFSIAAPALAQDKTPPSSFTRYIALQVEREPDYSAGDLAKLLDDDAYMGAIAPNLISAAGRTARVGANLPTDGYVTLQTNLGSTEILTLSFSGADQHAVSAAAEKVLKHLGELIPTRRRQAQDLMIRAQDRLKSAQADRDSAAKDLSEFKQKRGADVEQQLRDLQDRMRRMRMDLADITEKHAMESATRDYLRQAASAAAKDSVKEGGVDVSAIKEQIAAAQRDLDTLKKTYTETHPEVQAAMRKVSKLTSQLAAIQAGGGAPARENLEARLFDSEEEVFKLERRREWLETQLAAMAKDQGDQIQLNEQLRGLNDSFQVANGRFDEARSNVTMLERNASQQIQGAWIHVLAGG